MNTKPPPPTLLSGKTIDGPVSARIRIDGRPYLNYFGWCYFALAGLPTIRAAVRQTVELGAPFVQQVPAAAATIDPIFDGLESEAAAALGTEASIYFASGYLIGIIGLASLSGTFDIVAIDELAHYSLSDGVKLSGVPTYHFAHGDPDSLRTLLKKYVRAGQRPLVVTDGAFAVTGRVPPLETYAVELEAYDGRIFIDESHSFGVVGERGRGAAEFCGVEDVATTGATLSKAFCAHGAVLGCSATMAARLRTLPQIRGASAGSPLLAVAATASLRYVADHPEIRRQLREMASYLRRGLRELGMDVIESPAPIVSFKFGRQADMQALQRRLFERGIYIVHATNYIGSDGEGSLRCAIFRDHTYEDIDALLAAMEGG